MTVRKSLSRYQLGIFAVVLLSFSALPGCDPVADADADGSERSALLVRVDRAVETQEYSISRRFAGRVEPSRKSEVGFELGGELASVYVDEGDAVASGDVLAELDTARLKARLAEAEAALAQAKSAERLSQRTLERNQAAADFEGISAQELDLAIDSANAAQARLAAAEARVNSVMVDLSKAALRAPYDATVTARHIDEGQIVSPGQPVLAIQETAAPEVRVGVAGGLARGIQPGTAYELDIGGQTVAAVVKAVLPMRDPQTRTVDVILSIEDGDALPGDLARLQVSQAISEPGFWLPVSALAEGSKGLWTAYIALPIEEGGVADNGATHYLQPRVVEVLHEETDAVYVRGSLVDGDWYVSGGLTRVVPNQQVRIEAAVVGGAAHKADGS